MGLERLPRTGIQRVDLRLPTPSEALEWLRAQGMGAEEAALTLESSLGNPGQAAQWHADGTLALRAECVADLTALSMQRTQASAVAERWAADRPESRLWFASVLAREEARRLTRGERGTFGLTARAEIPKLAAWFGRANRARSLLSTTLRAELILLDLLRGWPSTERTTRRA